MKKRFISKNDPQVIRSILENIIVAIMRIERRFTGIHYPDDFLSSDEGIDRLDGIAMMLIAIGEQLKQLDKVSSIDLEALYPHIDWRGAKGIRDFLSHHYFVLDADVIFEVCQNKIPALKQAIYDLRSQY